MTPFIEALIIVGPICLVLGLGLGYWLFGGGKSSSSPSILTDADLKEIAMAVFAELVQPLADLDAAVAALPGKIASLPGDPAAAQDKADTIAAVEARLASATSTINAVGS